MSILSDITIRELSERNVISRGAFEDQVFADQTFQAEVASKCAGVNHPSAYAALLTRQEVDRRYGEQDFGMIFPFHPNLIRTVEERKVGEFASELCPELVTRKIISKGTTSYGYDVSLSEDVKLFTNLHSAVINPKRFDQQKCLADATVHTDEEGAKYVILPPNSYMLGVTVEYFRIPRDVMVVCLGKSTYARCGAIVNATPIEPGFHGNVVIEISNSTPSPMMIFLNEGIAQFLFFRGDRPCETSYGDRGGKYMGQTGVELAKV